MGKKNESMSINSDNPGSTGSFRANRGVTAAAALLFLAVWLLISMTWRNTLRDDAFIFYTYARNLLDGNGFVFNPGEYVNGCTSALYPLLIAAASWLRYSTVGIEAIPEVGHWLGCKALLVAALSGALLLRDEQRRFSAGSILFPFVLLAYPKLRAGVGMESFVLMALLCGVLYLYLERQWRLAALVAALAVLTRPDAALLLIVLAVDYLIRERRTPPLAALTIFFMTLLPWYIFSYGYFGSILPNTFGAKLAQSAAKDAWYGELYLRHLPESITVLRDGLGFEVVLLLLGLWVAFHTPQLRAVRLLVAWFVLHTLTYAFILNAPGYPWYYTPGVLTPALLLASALDKLGELSCGAGGKRKITAALTVFMLAAAAFLIGARYHKILGETDSTRSSKHTAYRSVAEWLNAHAGQGDSLSSMEIGVLGFYYRKGPIVDGLGLIQPEVVEKVRERDRFWHIKHFKPDWVLVRKPLRKRSEGFVKERWFQDEYQLIKADGGNFAGYRLWQRKQ